MPQIKILNRRVPSENSMEIGDMFAEDLGD